MNDHPKAVESFGWVDYAEIRQIIFKSRKEIAMIDSLGVEPLKSTENYIKFVSLRQNFGIIPLQDGGCGPLPLHLELGRHRQRT